MKNQCELFGNKLDTEYKNYKISIMFLFQDSWGSRHQHREYYHEMTHLETREPKKASGLST